MKRLFLAMALLPLTGCIWDPTNRTNQDNTTAITVTGYASSPGATVTISAKNLNNNTIQTIGTAISSNTAAESTPYPMYYWTTTITPAANYWSPQSVVVGGVNKTLNGLPASAGRLEFTAASGGSANYSTFSAAAKTCWANHYATGEAASLSGADCADGTSVTVFDNNGVGNGAPATGWVTDYTGGSPPPGTAWEVGHYAVQGLNIYGFLCRPTSAGTHKAVIINHGGFGGLDSTALGYCLSAAQNGWVAAMSAYRGELAAIPGSFSYLSGGGVELCQGEVTDVLRLTDIVRARADVDNTRVLMWGHSHGACVTERAVQRGALVKAAAEFSAPQDMAAWYNYCGPGSDCNTAAPGNQTALATTFGIPSSGFTVTPSQNSIPYDWRSPVSYKADLTARTDVKLLMIQGAADPLIHPSQACSMASGSGSLNWHFQDPGSPPSLTPAVDPAAPSDCSSSGLSWQSTAPPYGSWPGSRYLLVYDTDDHGSVLDITRAPWNTFIDWVNTIFP